MHKFTKVKRFLSYCNRIEPAIATTSKHVLAHYPLELHCSPNTSPDASSHDLVSTWVPASFPTFLSLRCIFPVASPFCASPLTCALSCSNCSFGILLPSIRSTNCPRRLLVIYVHIFLSGMLQGILASSVRQTATPYHKLFVNVLSPRLRCCFPSFCTSLSVKQFSAYHGYINASVSKCIHSMSYALAGPYLWRTQIMVDGLFMPNGILMHYYCSDITALDPTSESVTNDGGKLYGTIIELSSPQNSMERGLDALGITLTTPLVVEVLHRLRFEEKMAFRFFIWAGHQEYYTHEPQVYDEMIDILSSTKYKVKQFRVVCDLLDHMKRNNKSSVPVEALLRILRQHAEKHLTQLSKFAKKKMTRVKIEPEIHAFNELLDAMCKCCLVEDAEAMFKRIKNKVKPNATTYNILFFGWCRVRNPARGMIIIEDMIKRGLTPDNFTYTSAIDTFCKAGMVTEAAELLEFMRITGSTMSSPTAKTYAIMIVALAQSDKMDECFKLMGDMIHSGCLPDVSTYKEMIEGLCLAGKIEAAYKLLEEMGNKGYPPDIVTYNCFLKVLCGNRNNEEALRLYSKMIEVGCMPSVQTFTMLVRMFFDIGDAGGAFETLHEMDKRGCARDTDFYSTMIEGLFGCNRTEEACILLEEVINKGMKLPYQKFDLFLMQLSACGDLRAIHNLSEHMRKFYNPVMARRFALSQKRKSMSLRGK